MRITIDSLNRVYEKNHGNKYKHQDFYELVVELVKVFNGFKKHLIDIEFDDYELTYVLMSQLKYYFFECIKLNNIQEIHEICLFLEKKGINEKMNDLIFITLLEELSVFDESIIYTLVSLMPKSFRNHFSKSYEFDSEFGKGYLSDFPLSIKDLKV